MTTRVHVNLESGVLILRPETSEVEALNEAYHVLKDEISKGLEAIKLDLRNNPREVSLNELRPVSELLGSLITTHKIKMVVLIQSEDATGKILGALIAQNGGRVLTTNDSVEAQDWIDRKLN